MKKIAHFGAFDHDSFGDLLFPFLTEYFLPDFSIVHVAPTNIKSRLKDTKPVISIAEALSEKIRMRSERIYKVRPRLGASVACFVCLSFSLSFSISTKVATFARESTDRLER